MSDTRRGFFGRLMAGAVAAKVASAAKVTAPSPAPKTVTYALVGGAYGATDVRCATCGELMYVHHADPGDLGRGSAPTIARCDACMATRIEMSPKPISNRPSRVPLQVFGGSDTTPTARQR